VSSALEVGNAEHGFGHAAWRCGRLKFASKLITSGSRDWSQYFSPVGAPFVRITNLDRGRLSLRLDDLQSVSPPEDAEGERAQIREGDLLLSITAYLGSIGVAPAEVVGGYVSQHIALARIDSERFDSRWIGYCMLASQGQDQLVGGAYGGTKVQLSLEDVRNLWFPFPPLSTQNAIADYLDRETARLEEVLTAKERLLDLLTEKRRALITHAVTRGLNPVAPLRPSGIPWLGDVPAHWQTERTRWLFKERDERTENDEGEMLTVSHLTGVTPRAEKDVNMFEAETTSGYKICRKGDLAINTLWAWMGAMGIAPCDGIVSPAYNVYEPGPALDGGYVDVLVRLPKFAQEVIRYSKGVWSSRLRLYPEGFFEVSMPVPSLDEQRAIVAHIAAETAKLDALRASAERTIALLRERRAALIAAAVAGELRVAIEGAAC
jgi:type I restriction enzyme, S subunit